MGRRDALNRLIEKAEEAGFTVTRGRRTAHLKFTAPDGAVMFAPSTPSDYRSLKNTRAHLRRMGVDV